MPLTLWTLALLTGCRTSAGLGVTLNPDNPLSFLVDVSVDEDATVRIDYGADTDPTHTTPEQQLSAGQTGHFLVLGLQPDTRYWLQAHVEDADGTWASATKHGTSGTLPEGLEACSVSGPLADDPDVSDAIVCTQNRYQSGNGAIQRCVDTHGTPRWMLAHPDGHRMEALQALRDGGFAATGADTSEIATFDAASALTAEYTPATFSGRTRFVHDFVDDHEVIQLDTGRWEGALAFLTTTEDEVAEDCWVLGYGIIVYDPVADEVLWDWSTHGELGDGVPIDPAFAYQGCTRDQVHGNALVHLVDDDGGERFLFSVRKYNQIVSIDVDTDAVTWRLGPGGDFELVDALDLDDPQPLDDTAWFYGQHAPELQHRDGDRMRLLLYDNGNGRPAGRSDKTADYGRVLELDLDEGALLAAPLWSYGSPDPDSPEHFYSDLVGDADMLQGGDRLLYVKGRDGPYVAILSYPEGEELWRLSCPDQFEIERAAWYPSAYDTTWWYDVER